MNTEIVVAIIGAAATILASLLGLWGTRRGEGSGRRHGTPAPVLIGVATLAILGGIGVWIYFAAQRPSASSATSPTSPPTSTSPAVIYPATVEEYGNELVAAFVAHDPIRSTQLTTAAALNQLRAIAGNPNAAWSRNRCSAKDSSQYCVYYNDEGDVLGVLIAPGGVGRAHAVTEVRFDRTTFPTIDTDYVKEFIEAWGMGNAPRERRLATLAAAGKIGSMKVPTSYTMSTEGAMGHIYVTVNFDEGSIIFDLLNQSVGQARPQAITDIQIG